MTAWQPRLPLPLTEPELEGVLGDALRVLAETGVDCTHPHTVDRLREWGGIERHGERLRFAPSKVRAHLESRRATAKASIARPGFTLGGCWACLNYCDPETGRVRPATSDEAALMCRLWDARGIAGVVPVMPGDVPPELATLHGERLALGHSRFLGGGLTVLDVEEVRYLTEMNLVAGRRYRLLEQVAISPLRFNATGLATALEFLGNPDVEVSLGGAIPILGVSCPLDPRAALVQATAEALAFDVLAAALGFPGGLGLRLEPFDFSCAAIVFGSPEWCLYRILAIQMTGYLTGSIPEGGSFRSVSKHPDAQAACERTASVLWQAFLGARSFGAVGQLSVDEVFSPQQAMIDREILAYVERVVTGLELESGVDDAVALIAQGVREGGFAGVEDTVRRYREVYAFPDLFRHWSVGRWRLEGEPQLPAQAWARAREEIARADFQLPDDRHREVERIYQAACRYRRSGRYHQQP